MEMAEAWDGRSWSLMAVTAPVTSAESSLSGVSCSSTSFCTAVGAYTTVAAVVTLAEVWDGTAWSMQHTPNEPNPSSGVWGALNAVSCPTARYCTAVGDYNTATTTLALTEAWDGHAWSIQASPNPPRGVLRDALDGVSCFSARKCFAVGSANAVFLGTALAESWDGSAWTITPTPRVKAAETVSLSAVSCPSANACMAVGSAYDGIVTATLAEVWNGSGWTVTPTHNPARGILIPLDGLSCSQPQRCIAVGESAGALGISTLAEGWNGSNWSIQSTSDPEGAELSALAGVSCPSTDHCLAVGDYLDEAGATLPFAEEWNGSVWSILPPAPIPAGAQYALFSGVSCVSSDECVAVGSFYNSSTNLARSRRSGTARRGRSKPPPPGRAVKPARCPESRAPLRDIAARSATPPTPTAPSRWSRSGTVRWGRYNRHRSRTGRSTAPSAPCRARRRATAPRSVATQMSRGP